MFPGERFESVSGQEFVYLGVTNCSADATPIIESGSSQLKGNKICTRCPITGEVAQFQRTNQPFFFKCKEKGCSNIK